MRPLPFCLYANCSAKFQHGSVVADDFVQQMLALRTIKEGGDGRLTVRIELCGEKTRIHFTEAHLLEMRVLLQT